MNNAAKLGNIEDPVKDNSPEEFISIRIQEINRTTHSILGAFRNLAPNKYTYTDKYGNCLQVTYHEELEEGKIFAIMFVDCNCGFLVDEDSTEHHIEENLINDTHYRLTCDHCNKRFKITPDMRLLEEDLPFPNIPKFTDLPIP